MLVRVPGFGGLNLALAAQRLQDHEAIVAINCDFRNGDLRGIAGDTPASISAPLSGSDNAMFFRDRNDLVGSVPYADFVRSPAFYANGTIDKRVFYATEAGPTRILPAGSKSTATSDPKLGVPKPGNLPTPTYTIIDGAIKSVFLSTKEDGYISLDVSAKSVLKAYDKIIVSAPGFESTAYTIGKVEAAPPTGTATSTKVTLLKTKKKWVSGTGVTKVSDAKDLRTVFVKRDNHGLFSGDQIVLALGDTATTVPPLPSTFAQTFWVVTVFDTKHFSLTRMDTGAALVTDSDAGNLAKPLKYAKIAGVSEAFTTVPTVTLNTMNTDVAYTYAENEGRWENSAYSDTASMRSYLITIVNTAGDESEPSKPTDPFLLADGMPVTFESFPQAFDNSYLPPKGIRIYRTDASGQWRLIPPPTGAADQTVTLTWAEVQAVSTTAPWVDKLTDAQLAEVLTTTGWAVPPTGMHGIISAANGVVVGYTEKTVCPSVAYAPYAYPVSQQVSVDYKIMGLVATATGVCVLTEANPYVLVGNDPSGWGMVKLETNQACVAHKSIVDMGGMGIYASPDGLVGINGADVKLLTQGLLTREQWQSRYNPTSIVGAWAEDKYVATYLSSGARKGFIYDPQTNSIVDLDLAATAMANDYFDDKLLTYDGAFTWFAQDQNKPRAYTWDSKWFTLNAPNIFGWGQITAPIMDLTKFLITIEVWAFDGQGSTHLATYSNVPALLATTPPKTWLLSNVQPFRLPVPNNRYSAYQLRVRGTLPLSSINLANVMDELKQVAL